MASLLFIPIELTLNVVWWTVKQTCKTAYNAYTYYYDDTETEIDKLHKQISILENKVHTQQILLEDAKHNAILAKLHL